MDTKLFDLKKNNFTKTNKKIGINKVACNSEYYISLISVWNLKQAERKDWTEGGPFKHKADKL